MKRMETLDLLRGILFLNMVAYHWQYISGFVWGTAVGLTEAERIWQVCICGPFILLAGFCGGLCKKPAYQGAKVLLCGMAITIGSLVLMPSQTVWFGVLTLIAAGYLSVYLLDDYAKRLPQLLFLVVLVGLFLLTYPMRFGQADAADHFSFIPWLFLFWTGRTLQRLCGDWLSKQSALHWKLPLLNFLGRHTLVGYLAHLPILYGIATIIKGIGQ